MLARGRPCAAAVDLPRYPARMHDCGNWKNWRCAQVGRARAHRHRRIFHQAREASSAIGRRVSVHSAVSQCRKSSACTAFPVSDMMRRTTGRDGHAAFLHSHVMYDGDTPIRLAKSTRLILFCFNQFASFMATPYHIFFAMQVHFMIDSDCNLI